MNHERWLLAKKQLHNLQTFSKTMLRDRSKLKYPMGIPSPQFYAYEKEKLKALIS